MRPGLGESGLDRSIAAITGQPFELIRRDAQRCQVCYFLRIEAFHFVIRKPDKRLTTRIAARHFRAGADEQRRDQQDRRSEEHTSELQSLMRISYAVFCLKKK